MNTVKIYSAEEIRELTFPVAGRNLSVNQATGLKVYGGSTIYVNNKKVHLSEADLAELANAEEIFFIFAAKEKAYFFKKNGSFALSEFGHNEYRPKDADAFKSILTKNGIELIEK